MKKQKAFNLYKKACYGWFHVTSFFFDNKIQAIEFYKKNFNVKDYKSNQVGSYKITGL